MSTSNNTVSYSKENARIQLLKLIATHKGLTRPHLADITSLSRMSVSNMVSELIGAGLVAEYDGADENVENKNVSGRKPSYLKISDQSPCICGMLIEKDCLHVTLGDLSGAMLTETLSFPITSISTVHTEVVKTLYDGFLEIKKHCSRPVLAIGIASLGPLDAKSGVILRPASFHKIENLPIAEQISGLTGLPTFLMNEANACALAEQLYGTAGHDEHFLYLYIKNGIGAGVVLNGRLFEGKCGQNGGLGHVSVNAFGPDCECGSRGCLELYANLGQMRKKIRELSYFYPGSRLAKVSSPSWTDILDAAHTGDLPALLAMEEFCGYIALALCSVLNILDLSAIIVDYPLHTPGDVFETLLRRKLLQLRPLPFYHDIPIRKSRLIGNAALPGAIAIVADRVFRLELPLLTASSLS